MTRAYQDLRIPYPSKSKEYQRVWFLVNRKGMGVDEAVAKVKGNGTEPAPTVKPRKKQVCTQLAEKAARKNGNGNGTRPNPAHKPRGNGAKNGAVSSEEILGHPDIPEKVKDQVRAETQVSPELQPDRGGISADELEHAGQLLSSEVVPEKVKAQIRHALKGGTAAPPRIEATFGPCDKDRIGVLEKKAEETRALIQRMIDREPKAILTKETVWHMIQEALGDRPAETTLHEIAAPTITLPDNLSVTLKPSSKDGVDPCDGFFYIADVLQKINGNLTDIATSLRKQAGR